MLSGDNSILQKATDAKQTSERAEAKEQAQMDIMTWITDKTANHEDATLDDTKVKGILTGKSYVKTAGDTSFTTAKGEYEIPYSELYTSSNTTYTEYLVGQLVTLGTGNNKENFYVIEDSDKNTSTVKLIAEKNVETTNYTQSSSANTVKFDDSTFVYANSYIKELVDNYVTAIQTRIGKEILEGRLMTVNEVNVLGGDSDNHNTSGCDGLKSFINLTNYWLGDGGEEFDARSVYGEETSMDYHSVADADFVGLRPVILILKSNI